MFNQSPLNQHALGDAESFPVSVLGTETFNAFEESTLVGVQTAEGFAGQVEGDDAGWGLLGTTPLGEMPANDMQVIPGRLWSLFGQIGASDTFAGLVGETARIVQRIDLNLGSNEPSFIRIGTLRIDWELNQWTRLSFGLYYTGDPLSSYAPRAGHQTKITDFDGTTVLFAGSIERPRRKLLHTSGGNKLTMTCEALGWERIASRFHATKTYTDQDLDVIVADLVSTYLAADGVTATGLPTGITVAGTISFSYLKVSACFDELTKITGYWWRMSVNRNVEFYSSGTAATAPLAITATSGNWIDIDVSEDRSNYRNRQYLLGASYTQDDVTVTFYGSDDPSTLVKTFAMPYPIHTTPTIMREGFPEEVAVLGDTSGSANWYWSPGSNLITAADMAPLPSPSSPIVVTATGIYDGIRSVTKSSEVTDRADVEGGSGIYEDIDASALTFTNGADADAYAQGLIDRTAPIPDVVTILTDHGAGVLPGMVVPIDLPELALLGDYFVSKVSAVDAVGGKRLRYTITCSSNEPEESWKAGLTRKDATDRSSLPYTDTPV